MAEYIDKARFLEYTRSDPVGRILCEQYNLDGAIEAFPAADVVEIVRCKDCKYYNHRHHYCDGIGYWFGLEGEWSDNGFCYKAERRDDAEKTD